MHLYPINGAVIESADGHRVRLPRANLRPGDRVRLGARRDTERIQWVRDYHRRPSLRSRWLRQLHGRRRPSAASRTTTADTRELTEIKRIYDPDNLFHLNQNIPPASSRRLPDHATGDSVDPTRSRTSRLVARPRLRRRIRTTRTGRLERSDACDDGGRDAAVHRHVDGGGGTRSLRR